MLSDERLREMLAGTEGVTPGPWRWDSGDLRAGNDDFIICPQNVMGGDAPKTWADFLGSYGEHSEDAAQFNAAHIAACDPDTIRSVLTELLSLREVSAKMAEALEAALAWIDAVPADTPLPAMPGFDRDDVDAALALHRDAR